jgi:hypothetical protein
MKESPSGRFTGDKSSVVLFATLAAVVAYMTWIGVSGHSLPRWILWLTTVL